MDWWKQSFLYCERAHDPAFWAEPLNALSNVSFVVAAIWVYARMDAISRRDRPLLLLVWVAASIGVGSFLFHTFATRWSSFGDTGPIWTFVALYVFFAVMRFPEHSPGCFVKAAVGIGAAALAIYTIIGTALEEDTGGGKILNGSEQYAPALIGLAIFAAYLRCRRHPSRQWVMGGLVVFVVSLLCRTADGWLACDDGTVLGTHFLWHLLNGLMVALLLRALVEASVVARGRSPA